MGRQIETDEGITTTDDQQLHTMWPCVHHDKGVTCEEARREYSRLTRSGQKVARVIHAQDS